MDQQLADEIAGMLSTADSADVGSTVRVGIPCLAQMLEKNARLMAQTTGLQRSNTALMERARQAELALATEREHHSRLKEQWESALEQNANLRAAQQWTLDAYQTAAMRTHRGTGELVLGWDALGVAGEAGEVADLVKKHVAHGHELDSVKLVRELGDVLWYVAALAHDVGVSLSEVARENVKKLQARYPDGFDAERSKNRGEK